MTVSTTTNDLHIEIDAMSVDALANQLLISAEIELERCRRQRDLLSEMITWEEENSADRAASYELRDERYEQISRMIELTKLITTLHAHVNGLNR